MDQMNERRIMYLNKNSIQHQLRRREALEKEEYYTPGPDSYSPNYNFLECSPSVIFNKF